MTDVAIGYEDMVRVGPHQVTTLDLAKPENIDRVMAGLPARPSLLYVDPPWGGGLATGFRTKAGVQGKADFDSLMTQLGRILLVSGAQVSVVEMGEKWESRTLAAFKTASFAPPMSRVMGTYSRTRPMVYLVFAQDAQLASAVGAALQGVDDLDSPGVVMDLMGLQPGAVVFDPMCGNGTTAKHAVRRGLTFVGNELGPGRARETVRILRRATAT